MEWERFRRPGFRVAFDFPAVTPLGHAVARAEERVQEHPVAGDFERVHLSAPDSGELYVEVTRFPDCTPADEYRVHQPYLVQRLGSDAVDNLAETALGHRTAWTYGFRWNEGERSVVLLQVGPDTYRVIYDPRSELNTRILATLTVSD